MFILILLMMITVFSIATYVVVCIELKRLYDLIKIMSEKQIEITSKGIANQQCTTQMDCDGFRSNRCNNDFVEKDKKMQKMSLTYISKYGIIQLERER